MISFEARTPCLQRALAIWLEGGGRCGSLETPGVQFAGKEDTPFHLLGGSSRCLLGFGGVRTGGGVGLSPALKAAVPGRMLPFVNRIMCHRVETTLLQNNACCH